MIAEHGIWSTVPAQKGEVEHAASCHIDAEEGREWHEGTMEQRRNALSYLDKQAKPCESIDIACFLNYGDRRFFVAGRARGEAISGVATLLLRHARVCIIPKKKRNKG